MDPHLHTALLLNALLLTEGSQHAGPAALKQGTQSTGTSSDFARIIGVLKASALLQPVVKPGDVLKNEITSHIYQIFPGQGIRLYRKDGWGTCTIQRTDV